MTRTAAPGDTCWAINYNTFRWQVAIILSDSTIYFVPDTEVGVPVEFRPGQSKPFKRNKEAK